MTIGVFDDSVVEAAAVLQARGLLMQQETKAHGLDVTQAQYDTWLNEHAL